VKKGREGREKKERQMSDQLLCLGFSHYDDSFSPLWRGMCDDDDDDDG